MKTSILVLTILLVQFTLQADLPCKEGCLRCDPAGFCHTCYKRKLDPATNLTQCNQTEEKGGNCLYYEVQDQTSTCSWCEPGFAWVYEDPTQGCIPQPQIEGCLDMVMWKGQATCWMCQDSTPTLDRSKCVKQDMPPNCKIAVNNGSYGIGCFVCEQGYTADSGVCKIQQLKGCLQQYHPTPSLVHCSFCDIQNNWYAYSSAGRCKLQSGTSPLLTKNGSLIGLRSRAPVQKNFEELAKIMQE